MVGPLASHRAQSGVQPTLHPGYEGQIGSHLGPTKRETGSKRDRSKEQLPSCLQCNCRTSRNSAPAAPEEKALQYLLRHRCLRLFSERGKKPQLQTERRHWTDSRRRAVLPHWLKCSVLRQLGQVRKSIPGALKTTVFSIRTLRTA